MFSLVYHVPGEAGDAHEQLLQRAHALYASANLLNPMAFSSLKQMETRDRRDGRPACSTAPAPSAR